MAHNFQGDIDAIQRIAAVPTILDVVCRSTGMGFAAVARVTEDRWVMHAIFQAEQPSRLSMAYDA